MGSYSPRLPADIVKALYYEARRLGTPMTRLAASLLTMALRESPGWRKAQEEIAESAHEG